MTDAWGAQLDAGAFGRAAAALVASESEHVPIVADVTALGERRELLLAQADGPTLAALRLQRTLTPGEAVTVVVGAARAVAAVHAAGYCGVGLADDDLRFDASACPMVFGIEHVRETIRAGADGRADDWRAVAELADRLGLLAQRPAQGVFSAQQAGLGLAIASLSAAESDEHLAQLEDALFDIAEPAPVQLAAPAGQLSVHHPAPAPTRAALPGPAPEPLEATVRRASRGRAVHRRPTASAVIEAFDAGPAALLAGPLGRARQAAATVRSRIRGRTRLVIAAAATALVMTVALVLLLPSNRAAPSGGAGAATASNAPGGAPTVSPGGVRAGVPAAGGATTNAARPRADSALTGTDPVAAASVLIARRDACLAGPKDEQQHCFAQLADSQASALGQPDRPLAGLTPSLLERSGATALIALTPKSSDTPPASALLMRTEAGWRLRQLFEN